jgi:hypothetical protein
MLTYYALEVIVKDRLREHNKELKTRAALREAFGDQAIRFSLFRKLGCRIRAYLAGLWSWDFLLIQPIGLSLAKNPCMAL